MQTVLIISFISLIIALVLIGRINYNHNKKTQNLDIKYPLKTTYSYIEYLLIALINIHRKHIGLNELKVNDTISTVCQEHSLNLAKLISKKHENALLRKEKLKKALGITRSGEIVAKGQGTAKGILKMWLKSPKHKEVLERNYWTKFGISIEQSILKRNYITVIFTK